MTTPIDTEQWALKVVVHWQEKNKPVEMPCRICFGQGHMGYTYDSNGIFDKGPSCTTCRGRGFLWPIGSKPPVYPPGLKEHMENALQQFFEQ